jgi:predicted PolB exonuclease-like 3'-5' exonuclease
LIHSKKGKTSWLNEIEAGIKETLGEKLLLELSELQKELSSSNVIAEEQEQRVALLLKLVAIYEKLIKIRKMEDGVGRAQDVTLKVNLDLIKNYLEKMA